MKSMASNRKTAPERHAVRVTGPELPSPNFRLYPYQARWIQDKSRLKIACKSRRIGYSFAAGFRALRSCLEWKHNVIILSKKEELAKEFISEAVAPKRSPPNRNVRNYRGAGATRFLRRATLQEEESSRAALESRTR